jgi:hypothetical protein
MAFNASATASNASPEAEAPKSSFSFPNINMPNVPDVSAPSASVAVTKARDILTTTAALISSKAGDALEVFGRGFFPFILIQRSCCLVN